MMESQSQGKLMTAPQYMNKTQDFFFQQRLENQNLIKDNIKHGNQTKIGFSPFGDNYMKQLKGIYASPDELGKGTAVFG